MGEDGKKRKIIKWVLAVIVLLLIIAILFKNKLRDLIGHQFEKPIIYLYPTEETDILVELGYPENVTVSYPEYKEGWRVTAKPSGDLVDVSTGKNLYALYYECNVHEQLREQDYGFIVKSEEIIEFLEDKLSILGLNDREREEFIVYWLPRLKQNEYNYIRFANTEEINKYMPLNIYPVPDTTIRVMMLFKGIEEPFSIEEQTLVHCTRNGYTAVEWGGMEIK